MNLKLDVRLPIGGMFALDGLILAGHGLLAGRAEEVRVAGLSINVVWGAVLILFGGATLGRALRTRVVSPPR